MPKDRRYGESEIRRIFELAASESPESIHDYPDGLTLSELKSIGEEVGIPATQIEKAAHSLHGPTTAGRLQVAGLPLGVRKEFDMPRAPSDREWGMLVAELRRVFAAEGSVTSGGGLCEWRNGNLHATIEPTREGYRLRLGTRKGQATLFGILSGTWALIALGVLVDGSITGAIGSLLVSGALLTPMARLPKWARTRESQMEYIGAYATRLLAESKE